MIQPANLVGKRIRVSRLSRKPRLTQLTLAAKLQLKGLDLDQAQISKIESGIRPVTDVELAAIAEVLNVSASWLLGETGNPQRLS